jgi:hypothetical protein
LLKKQYLVILVLVSTLFLSFEATPVFAGIPTITNVVVWNNGGNTTLNVTVSHSPQSSFHHADAVEVNMSGTIETLMVPLEPTTEFVIIFDLGSIAGTPLATVRAHCTVDLWGASYGPVQVPEFLPFVLLSAMVLATAFSTATYRRFTTRINKQKE